MRVFPDLVVEIDQKCSAQIESWLLGHGRIPRVLNDQSPGRLRYLVKEARPEGIKDLALIGARALGDAGPYVTAQLNPVWQGPEG